MSIPSICSLSDDNSQLRRIAALGLTAQEEPVYKATLAEEYRRTIADSALHQPATSAILEQEFQALLTLPTAELAAGVPVRGGPPDAALGAA